MSKVNCQVEYTTDYNDNRREIDCVIVTCSKCGYQTTSWGHGVDSVKRCMAIMNEECPECENSFYVEE